MNGQNTSSLVSQKVKVLWIEANTKLGKGVGVPGEGLWAGSRSDQRVQHSEVKNELKAVNELNKAGVWKKSVRERNIMCKKQQGRVIVDSSKI